tara:strand:- start:2985 stop:3764 length:780 start_codon:yes stop_codon:yes gene_type:complete
MNIILERWKGYIAENEESYAKYNTNLVLRGPSTLNISNISSVALLLKIARPLTVEEMFNRIPQLRNHKIKKVLGAGTLGVALELDNGRALKLYKEGYMGTEESFYDAEAGKIFSGRGEVSTLPVFDRGTVAASGDSNEDIKYVEMAQVVPFDKYYALTGRGDALDEADYLVPILRRFAIQVRKGLYSRDELREKYLEYLEVLTKDANLTLPEVNGLLIMITYVLVNYGAEYLQDLHPGNFGVVSQTIGKPNPYFVIFDP